MSNSSSKAPSSQSDCVMESGIATTLPMVIISTNSLRNCGVGCASGRSRKARSANSDSVARPMRASTQPSDVKISRLRPLPRETIDSSGMSSTFMIAEKARMSLSLMTPRQAMAAVMPYCTNRLAMTLKEVRKRSPKLVMGGCCRIAPQENV